MSFKEWNDDHWKVRQGRDENHMELVAPGRVYVFNKHDFLELAHNVNMFAEDLFEKEEWFVHDGNIINRRTGQQLIGVTEVCRRLNELTEEVNELKECIKIADDLIFCNTDSCRIQSWEKFKKERGIE